jgi:hypothetical protein
LFLQQARERDPGTREALLHRIQQLTIDRADGNRAAGGGARDQLDPDGVLPVL